MAQPGEHFAAAQKLVQRASAADSDDAWAIVFLFYSSLHLVDGHLRTKAVHFHAENHGARSAALRQAKELGQAVPTYRALQSLSEQVRYDPCFVPKVQDFDTAKRSAEKVWAIVEPKLTRWLAANPT